MISRFLPAVLLLLISSSQASLIPRTTASAKVTSYSNSSSTTSSRSSTITQNCCFIVQDTVSEQWWEQTSFSYAMVNLTSIITLITKYPNTTVTNFENSTTTVNRTWSSTWGVNPITNFMNDAAEPTEVEHVFTGTEPVVTGGVTIQSPAAFYVYNSVKIITAAAVTDSGGNVQCGVPWVPDGGAATFENMNSNAQAYFGGSSIAGRIRVITGTITTTETYLDTAWATNGAPIATSTATTTYGEPQYGYIYTDEGGETITHEKPTGTVISLVTPFIYQPAKGARGKTGIADHCDDSASGSENYGYVPQTLLDFLIQNKHYSEQYPGLENCLPGGPSIIPETRCPMRTSVASYQQPMGGDLTESTVVYVTPPGIKSDPTSVPAKPEGNQPSDGGKPKDPEPEPQLDGGGARKPDPAVSDPAQPENTGPPRNPPAGKKPDPPVSEAPKSDPSLADVINSIMGGPAQAIPITTPNGNPVIIPSATEIPVAEAPPGLVGEVKTVNGKPVYVVPGPTTIPAPAALPVGAENIGSKTVIGGSTYFVISGPTNIPLSNAPAGVEGKTTYIGGVPYLEIGGPATFAAPQAAGGVGSIGSTTLIGGVTFVVYPGPTNIPLSNAPSGLSGITTEVNGVTYLAIPRPTTFAAAPAGGAGSIGRTTLINGTPFVVIPGPTMIPAAGAPSEVSGAKTTLLDGTPYLIIPSQTTVALSPSRTAGMGQLTVIIDGSSKLIISGPTTIPVNPDFPISGKTTVIDGKTMVIVSGATTVAAKTSSKTTSSSSSSGTSTRASSTADPTASDAAAPDSGGNRRLEFNACLGALALLIAVVLL